MPKQKAVDLSLRPINQVSTDAFRALKGLLGTCTLRGSDVPLFNSFINVIDQTIAFDTNHNLTAEMLADIRAPKTRRRRKPKTPTAPDRVKVTPPEQAPAEAPAKSRKRGRKLPAKNRSADTK